MKEKKGILAVWITAIFLLLVLLGYFLPAFYYRNVFHYNTWINGIYSTGKTVEEVNSELMVPSFPEISLRDREGNHSVISMERINYQSDYSRGLLTAMLEQNPYLWVRNFLSERTFNLVPEISFDELLLQEQIAGTEIVLREKGKKNTVEIYKGEEGYALYNGRKNVLNEDRILEVVKEAISLGQMDEIDLWEAGCYSDLPMAGEDIQQTLALYEKIYAFQNCRIIYDMGDELFPLSPSMVSDWIALDEDGEFLVDETGELVLKEDAIDTFIEQLAEEYDTYGKPRIFRATRGEDVLVEGGTYGNQIDQKAEKLYLKEAFQNKAAEVHVPKYKKEAFKRGKEDIGDTYVEIDMTEQKMYYYRDGEIVFETDVVTGNMRRKFATPSGVNFVYSKQRNRILRGQGYASPVKYWMPVNGNIGIHDASWRKEFGGSIYEKNGSHGCINVPPEVMPEFFDMVELRTPVILFY